MLGLKINKLVSGVFGSAFYPPFAVISLTANNERIFL